MRQPFTPAMIVKLRTTHNLPSHAERLRARGMLTRNEIADQLGVHSNTIKDLPGFDGESLVVE